MHFFSLNLFIFIAWLQTPSFRYNLTLSYTGCKMTTKSFYTCIRESSITIDTQSTLGILGLCFLGYIWFSEYCDQRKRANFFFGLNPTWQSMHSIQLFNKNTRRSTWGVQFFVGLSPTHPRVFRHWEKKTSFIE